MLTKKEDLIKLLQKLAKAGPTPVVNKGVCHYCWKPLFYNSPHDDTCPWLELEKFRTE